MSMNDYSTVADVYDSFVASSHDLAFWSRRAATASGPILEVTAGTGRVTAALRAASSEPIIAVDLAPAMLRRLVARFSDESVAVWAVGGDATRLPLASARFALAAIPFNSLGEVIEAADRAAVLQELHRVVRPGGYSVVTLHDPVRRRETLDGTARRLGPFQAGDQGLEVVVRGRLVALDVAESEQTYRFIGSGGEVLEERRLTLRFALPDAASLIRMAAEVGFEPQRLYGDYDESPYTPGESPFIIAVLRRW